MAEPMNETNHVRVYEWANRFRDELCRKVAKLEQPTDTEIDRVARWMCDVHTWHPNETKSEGTK